MRSISTVKLIFFLIFLLTFLLTANSSESEKTGGGWTLGFSTGVQFGQVQELVFPPSESPHRYHSALYWDIKPAVMAGINTLWDSGKRWQFKLNLMSAVPSLPAGSMEDYDWLDDSIQEHSHWSVSDVWLRWGLIADLGIHYELTFFSHFRIFAGVGYHLDFWAWRDRVRDTSYNETAIGMEAITYSVAYNVIPFSLTAQYEKGKFAASIAGSLGPVLAYGIDHHKLRTDGGPDGLYFYDRAFGFPWVGANASAAYQFNRRFSLRLTGQFAWLRETEGVSTTLYTDGVSTADGVDSIGFAFIRYGCAVNFIWQL